MRPYDWVLAEGYRWMERMPAVFRSGSERLLLAAYSCRKPLKLARSEAFVGYGSAVSQPSVTEGSRSVSLRRCAAFALSCCMTAPWTSVVLTFWVCVAPQFSVLRIWSLHLRFKFQVLKPQDAIQIRSTLFYKSLSLCFISFSVSRIPS